MRAVELSDLRGARPCKTCYPDAPNYRIVRRACSICNRPKLTPCEHNGGVLVTLTRHTSYISVLRDPGDEFLQTTYVWPDEVWKYEISEQGLAS